MWAMAQNSMALFFRGKLFRDPGKAYRQLLIGIVVTAIVFVVAAKLGAAPVFAALVAGLFGGLLQPYLFKDLRYN